MGIACPIIARPCGDLQGVRDRWRLRPPRSIDPAEGGGNGNCAVDLLMTGTMGRVKGQADLVPTSSTSEIAVHERSHRGRHRMLPLHNRRAAPTAAASRI